MSMGALFQTWMDSPDSNARPPFDQLREELFRTTGYCVLRAFCSIEQSLELRRFWHRHPMKVEPKGYWPGRANYAMEGPATVQRYECMFWNPPEHALTYDVAWSALLFRNVVWGLQTHSNIFPFERFVCSYRLTRSDMGDPGVRPHRDTEDRDGLPHRIQVSVALSTTGMDFRGGGTRLRTRSGEVVNIHEAHQVQAGDLILFDQLLEHSVDPVLESDPSAPASGHWRLLMPDHPMLPSKPRRLPHWLQAR
jgi:hypothetical protein